VNNVQRGSGQSGAAEQQLEGVGGGLGALRSLRMIMVRGIACARVAQRKGPRTGVPRRDADGRKRGVARDRGKRQRGEAVPRQLASGGGMSSEAKGQGRRNGPLGERTTIGCTTRVRRRVGIQGEVVSGQEKQDKGQGTRDME
jgi:hypothetical protein